MKHLLALSTGRILALLTGLLLTACSIVPSIVTGTLTSAATSAAISLLPEGKPEYASIGISEPYFTQLTTDDKGKHYLTYRVDYETSIKDKIQLPVVTYILDRDGKPILNDEGKQYLSRVDYIKVSKKEPSGFFEPQIPFEWIPRGHSDLRLSYFVLDPYIKDSVLIRSGILVSVGQIIQREPHRKRQRTTGGTDGRAVWNRRHRGYPQHKRQRLHQMSWRRTLPGVQRECQDHLPGLRQLRLLLSVRRAGIHP